jgi:cation transport ATPase
MNEQMQTLKDDIAFMRALAQEGQAAPPLGGAMLALAGTVFAAASVLQWAILSKVLVLPTAWLAAIWGAALLAFFVGLFLLRNSVRSKPGAFSPANKASGAVWQGIGMAIFFSFFAMSVASWRLHNGLLIYFSPSLILLFYGVGWTLGRAMSGQAWMRWCAWGSFAAAVGLAALIGSPLQYLAYAACLLLLATLPGVILMRREPSDIV